jgi:hypothetical protein
MLSVSATDFYPIFFVMTFANSCSAQYFNA